MDILFKKALQKNGFDLNSTNPVNTDLARSCGVEAFSEILDLCFQCIEKELHKINVGQRLDWDLIRDSDVKPSGNFLIILKRIISELEKRKGFILIFIIFFL